MTDQNQKLFFQAPTKQTNKQTSKHTNTQTHKHTNKQAYKQTDTQAEVQRGGGKEKIGCRGNQQFI